MSEERRTLINHCWCITRPCSVSSALLHCDLSEMCVPLSAVQLPGRWLASTRPGIPAADQRGHTRAGARVWEEPFWDRECTRLRVPLPHFSSQGQHNTITLGSSPSFICLFRCCLVRIVCFCPLFFPRFLHTFFLSCRFMKCVWCDLDSSKGVCEPAEGSVVSVTFLSPQRQ